MAVVGLHCCVLFSRCSKLWVLLIMVGGFLTAAASLVVEHSLSSCGTRAYLFHSLWDLPRPGIELVSPGLASGLFTTEPQMKPKSL